MNSQFKWAIIIGVMTALINFMISIFMSIICFLTQPPNGLRYLRWGGDGEAVQPEKR